MRSGGARRASKSYRLHVVPPVLLLHLKRFRRDARGVLSKIGVHVAFEFEFAVPLAPARAPAGNSNGNGNGNGADMAAAGNGSGNGSGRSADMAAGAAPAPLPTRHYRLVGLVEHIGSMKSGHYVSYVCRQLPPEQGPGRPAWFCVSDTAVREVAQSEVAAAQAYMLMYVRV